MSRFGKTLGHTFIYMTGLVLNRGVTFLLVPVFTRVFAPADFAVWDLCNTTLLLLTRFGGAAFLGAYGMLAARRACTASS